MPTVSFSERRAQLETYFDRTAVEAWSRLTSNAPLGRIRATVRAGRDEMRGTLLGWLPDDMRGMRLLDAGCGTGMLAIEAARRGAHVLAIDLSATLVELAEERMPADIGPGRVDFHVGDMLAPSLGHFDYVVAMDSLIHYRPQDVVPCAVAAGDANPAWCSVHLCAAYPGLGGHARRRPGLPARRPCPRHRTCCGGAIAGSDRQGR